MTEPEVHHVKAYMPLAQELLDDTPTIGEAMCRALAGEPLPPSPPAPTTPPAGHLRLLAATDGPLRAVVELHAPVWDGWWECRGCDLGTHPENYPDWPCSTVQLIAEQLDVDLREQP